jgi:alkylation response protein AidB-like acyl-CoA dehydrogenase
VFDEIPTGLTDEQRAIREVARDVARTVLAPMVAEIDRTDEFPAEAVKALAALGMYALSVPEEYGGVGADIVTECLVIEELATAFPAVALSLCPSIVLAHILDAAGAGPMSDAWLRRMADTQCLVGICLTEPNAGSDSAAIDMRARPVDGGWQLSGTKIYVTNGGVADLYCVFARTGTTEDRAKGITGFIVDASTPGLSVARFEDKMGIRGSKTAELVFDDVFVAADHVVGEVGKGFGYVMYSFDASRPVIGVLSLGIARAALAAAAEHTAGREQFGQPVANFQGVQFMLADMATGIESARTLVYEVARLASVGRPANLNALAAMAKCYATDVAMQVTTDAVQLFGGAGYMRDLPVERMMRDAKIFQIFEGTNQIQRVIIGRHVNAQASAQAGSPGRRR